MYKNLLKKTLLFNLPYNANELSKLVVISIVIKNIPEVDHISRASGLKSGGRGSKGEVRKSKTLNFYQF